MAYTCSANMLRVKTRTISCATGMLLQQVDRTTMKLVLSSFEYGYTWRYR